MGWVDKKNASRGVKAPSSLVAQACERHTINQRELAELLGVRQATVCLWAHDRHAPVTAHMRVLKALASGNARLGERPDGSLYIMMDEVLARTDDDAPEPDE